MTLAQPTRGSTARRIGLGTAVALIVAAIAVPPVFGWDVHAAGFPPLLADWRPEVGPGTIPAVALGVLVVVFGVRASERARWRVLLVGSFVVATAWIVSLATIGGVAGISGILGIKTEYLPPARAVTDVGAMLRGFIDRIPLHSADNWPVNVAGHPPGAFLFFILLVRIGLGSGLAAGLVVIVLAATTPAAVLITLRRLGAEPAARRAAPFLVAGPAAVWLGVTADAVFGMVAAWGLCCLAVSATASRRSGRIIGAVAAGLLLGLCVYLSYGLTLIGLLALAVLFAARSWRPLPIAAGAAVAVAAAFTLAGFSWWTAYPVLLTRYRDSVAMIRPTGYWSWADLADLALCAGPIVGAAVASGIARIRDLRSIVADRVVVALVLAAAAIIALADASGLSKAEVERIWLPFVPWLLVGTALLPPGWRRFGLAGNVVLALAIEHLLHTAW